jgi:hypothetical protein
VRNPIRTEAEAFGFVVVVGIVFGAIAMAAVLGGAAAALGVLAGIVVGAGAGIYMRSDPPVKEPAIWERRPESERPPD